MKILFVAMSNSIHTARWIGQIADIGWSLHIFPSIDYGDTHKDLRNVTIHHSIYGKRKNQNDNVILKGQPVFSNILAWGGRWLLKHLNPHYRRDALIRVIEEIQPDIIHSMEFQSGAYLVLDTKQEYIRRHGNFRKFPVWIVTNWGSDIYLFGKYPEHQDKIKGVLKECDYYSCECYRDVKLAKDFEFKGKFLPVLPNAGGFDLASLEKSKRYILPPSNRKIILLKGYHGWAGRALVGFDAIELCADKLRDFRVEVFSCSSEEVKKKGQQLSQKTGIAVNILPPVSHEEMLSRFGNARIYVGLSISDAISTSLLEAMVMGAFPIQSDTSCADEWITNGKSGFIVPAEDTAIIAKKILQALEDDKLVDNAAEINSRTVKERLDYDTIKSRVITEYEKILSQT